MEREGDIESMLNEIPNASSHNLLHHLLKSLSPVSSSSVSNGFDVGLSYSAPFEEPKYQTPTNHYQSRLPVYSELSNSRDGKKENMFDGVALSGNFQRMHIGDERNGFSRNEHVPMDPNRFGFDFGGCASNGSIPYYIANSPYEDFDSDFSDYGGFQSSIHGVPASFNSHDMNSRLHLQKESRVGNLMGSNIFNNQSNAFCSNPSVYKRNMDYLMELGNELGSGCFNGGIQLQSPSMSKSYLKDNVVWSQQCRIYSNIDRDALNPLDSSQLIQPKLALGCGHPLYNQRVLSAIPNSRVSQSLWSPEKGDVEAFNCEDSFIIRGKNLNYVIKNECDSWKGGYKKTSHNEILMHNLREKGEEVDCQLYSRRICGSSQGRRSSSQLLLHPNYCSLAEAQGCIYSLAKDHNGCRFLQRMFDGATVEDVQLVFNETIKHVVELMMNPFGNYLMQKLLDVCNEDQRMQIVLALTEEPGELVRISLNAHGTRVVQKLVMTLKTRQQISLVVLALEPYFLDLTKDHHGNHVVQRCLEYLSCEDIKFFFYDAAKYCVDIATHRHGCCVLQRCITRSTGKHGEKLVAEISANGLLLAQDDFGNYVIQYIIELKIPSAIASLMSQFEGNYVHLSMQKFSSHVVEKCLKHLEESRPRIVHEFLSVPHFEQLMQDPFANYVIQSALEVTKGPLHASLIEAVRPHIILRTSPYCKKIFSRTLFKK
ncbi:putative pumilio-like 7, chloroplastic [Vitis vinifera]|nr:putative pumilio-like 7, chloroplastic [Vitis vinifera]